MADPSTSQGKLDAEQYTESLGERKLIDRQVDKIKKVFKEKMKITLRVGGEEDSSKVETKDLDDEFDEEPLNKLRCIRDVKNKVNERLSKELGGHIENLRTELVAKVRSKLSNELKSLKEVIKTNLPKGFRLNRRSFKYLLDSTGRAELKVKIKNALLKVYTEEQRIKLRAALAESFVKETTLELNTLLNEEISSRKDMTEFKPSELKDKAKYLADRLVTRGIQNLLLYGIEEKLFDDMADEMMQADSDEEGADETDPSKKLLNALVILVDAVMSRVRGSLINMVAKEFNETWIFKDFKLEKKEDQEPNVTRNWREDIDGVIENTKSIVAGTLKRQVKEVFRAVLAPGVITASNSKEMIKNLKIELTGKIISSFVINLAIEIKKALALSLYRPEDFGLKSSEALTLQEEVDEAIDKSIPSDVSSSNWETKTKAYPAEIVNNVTKAVDDCVSEELEKINVPEQLEK